MGSILTPEEIEQKIWEKYPLLPLEKTCSTERYFRTMARMDYRIRLQKENERLQQEYLNALSLYTANAR